MMTGLIGRDLRREDRWSGPSHDDSAQDLSYGTLLKNLAYPTDS
jgi:hypothetical protein